MHLVSGHTHIVMGDPEIINISNVEGLGNSSPPVPGSPLDRITSNFGGGIELLMNERRMTDKDNEVGNINAIENELNELNDDIEPVNAYALNNSAMDEPFARVTKDSYGLDADKDAISIGKQTADVPTNVRTWDGYENLNSSIGFNPDLPDGGAGSSGEFRPQMTKEELLREKFACLRKLEELEKKGVKLTRQYNMESTLSEMQGEYETIIAEKERSNSIKFQSKILMACITGVEFLNKKIDPFDIKLEGWSEQINENISDYDDVFSELHEKYKSRGKMAPELKLMFQVAGSAMMIHMTNTMFKSAIPGMDDIMKQNPELMQQFTRAAANSMSDSRPGFSNFMNMSVGGGGGMHGGYEDDGIRFSEMGSEGRTQSSTRSPHEEIARNTMKGPYDVDDILSNMKTKISNDVHAAVEENYYGSSPKQPMHHGGLSGSLSDMADTDKSSNISIHDLKELAGQKMPKRGRRSGKKDIVSVSLDM